MLTLNRSATMTTQNSVEFTAPPLDRASTGASTGQTTLVTLESTNVANRKAGLQNSLYQNCVAMKRRLALVPGFDSWLEEMDDEYYDNGDSSDPVTSIWNLFRRGTPLVSIFNALELPGVFLEVKKEQAEVKMGKDATFKFITACRTQLHYKPEELFMISDLYGTDTGGLVKVMKVVHQVLDLMEERGRLMKANHAVAEQQTKGSLTKQENIVKELVETERDYVQHLETLESFKHLIERLAALPGDVIHEIFMNLTPLLDFQRRFLVRMEQTNALPPHDQDWGSLFVQYKEGFRIYEPFLANSDRCNKTILREWQTLISIPLPDNLVGIVESPAVFLGFMIKPFSRLVKYPLLLGELASEKCDFDDAKKARSFEGRLAINGILDAANEATHQYALQNAFEELKVSVEDWKGHDFTEFGRLTAFGNQTVLKGEGAKEFEKEYKIYLFTKIILCCKELDAARSKNRLGSIRGLTAKPKGKMQLKGRIFMASITDVMSYPKNNGYQIQIFWKNGSGVEHFTLRFANNDIYNKWRELIQKSRTDLGVSGLEISPQGSRSSVGPSDQVFSYMQGTMMENPYSGEYDDDDDDTDRSMTPGYGVTPSGSHSDLTNGISPIRHPSNPSLRSRSTTGGSNIHPAQIGVRVGPGKVVQPDLTLATNYASYQTPDEKYGTSYFSPVDDSPGSARMSGHSGISPFGRQGSASMPQQIEAYKHFTAPSMGRPPMHEDDGSLNGHLSQMRLSQRPSQPPIHNQQQMALAQQRMRSTSNPDPNHPMANGPKRTPHGYFQDSPVDNPLPPIPQHVMRAPLSRTQSNSAMDYLDSQRGISARHHHQPNLSRTAMQSSSTNMNMHNHSQNSAPRGTPSNYPAQLKVKVYFDPQPSHVTIVVPIIIKHQSLIDRIDSKMERVSGCAISKGTARLKYRDNDKEMITITNDDDVQMAIEEWSERQDDALKQGLVPDFELYFKEVQPSNASTFGGI